MSKDNNNFYSHLHESIQSLDSAVKCMYRVLDRTEDMLKESPDDWRLKYIRNELRDSLNLIGIKSNN